METLNKTARTAGFLYLLFVFCGIFYLRYIPSKLITSGNITATIDHIAGLQILFKFGILSEILADIIFLLLGLTLYKLLHRVDKIQAFLMVILIAFSILESFISLQNKLAVLTLINKTEYRSILSMEYFKAEVLLNLDLYKNGILIGQIFWGLWLFPLGYLVFKSGFLPKFLGGLLMVGCCGYLANFVGIFFFNAYKSSTFANYITLPASLGELAICLWLLVAGIRGKLKFP